MYATLMASALTTLLFAGATTVETSEQAAPAWFSRVTGRYQSQIYNQNDLTTGTTEFSRDKTGALVGNYFMDEAGVLVPGRLSQCQAVQVQVLRCRWFDKYGTGTLEVTFTEDFTSFTGLWGDQEAPPEHVWNGQRLTEKRDR